MAGLILRGVHKALEVSARRNLRGAKAGSFFSRQRQRAGKQRAISGNSRQRAQRLMQLLADANHRRFTLPGTLAGSGLVCKKAPGKIFCFL
jgi:hypothetical protein